MGSSAIAKGLALATLLLVLIAAVSRAQSLLTFDIENLEKLEWLFETRQIDGDEYDRLLEFFVDSLDIASDTLNQSPDMRMADLRSPAIFESIDFDYRMYHRAREDKPYRQLYDTDMDLRSGMSFEADLERDSDGEILARHRAIGWSFDNYFLQLGSIDPVFCSGLVLGRHPIFLDDKRPRSSALYPTRSRYNGLFASMVRDKWSASIAASADRNETHRSSVLGAQVEHTTGEHIFRVSAAATEISNRSTGADWESTVYGFESELRFGRSRFNLSAALDPDGDPAYLLTFTNTPSRQELSIWRYSSHYDNPFMAARANSDTREIDLDEVGLNFRSRYSGETGLRLRTELKILKRLELRIVSNLWRSAEYEKYRMKKTLKYSFGARREIRIAYLTGDDSLSGGAGGISKVRASYTNPISRNGTIAVSCYTLRDDRRGTDKRNLTGECRLRFGSERLRSDLIVRYYDPDMEESRDNYIYVSTAQAIRPSTGVILSVLLSTRFGPEQDSIDRMRLKLEAKIRI